MKALKEKNTMGMDLESFDGGNVVIGCVASV